MLICCCRKILKKRIDTEKHLGVKKQHRKSELCKNVHLETEKFKLVRNVHFWV